MKDSAELIDRLKEFDRAFVERAIAQCDGSGNNAVLLLVGSRAAGYSQEWSDLDMWLIGDKGCLSAEQQIEHDAKGGIFVDRGDLEAHWHFYDRQYVVEQLSAGRPEMMWLLATSKFMHGDAATAERLKASYSMFPRTIAEKKVKWLVGSIRSHTVPMCRVASLGEKAGAFAIAGQALDSLYKLCCAAECRPWPYGKWLSSEAKRTQLGATFCARAEELAASFMSQPAPAPGQLWKEWPPRVILTGIVEALPASLKALGWQGDWVDDPWKTVGETFSRAAP